MQVTLDDVSTCEWQQPTEGPLLFLYDGRLLGRVLFSRVQPLPPQGWPRRPPRQQRLWGGQHQPHIHIQPPTIHSRSVCTVESAANYNQTCKKSYGDNSYQIETRRERLKSALYLRLRKRKTIFLKNLKFLKKIFFQKSRIVPKNVKGGTLLDILLQNIKYQRN